MTQHAMPEDEIARAAALLRDGGVVAFPTETVYGLGACVFDLRAIARVFEIKGRPRFDPLIVHVADAAQAACVAADFTPLARRLADRFWPGPLTLVLPRQAAVPDLVTAGLPTVAVRAPDHPVAQALLRQAGFPLAAPSANPFGAISPTTAAHVREGLGRAVDLVLDGGPCRVGIESTIVAVDRPQPVLLRAGGVPIEEVEAVVGPVARAENSDASAPRAPGQLARHYAPRTPLVLSAARDPCILPGRIGLLAFRSPRGGAGRFAAVEVLSASGDLREAAARLFAAMRRLDGLGLDGLVAEPVPDHGLGRAINDRLRRAAAPRG